MKYEEAKFEIVYCENCDVITTSILREGSDGTDVGEFGNLFPNSSVNF